MKGEKAENYKKKKKANLITKTNHLLEMTVTLRPSVVPVKALWIQIHVIKQWEF